MARLFGLPDAPIEQGPRADILSRYGLDAGGLLDGALGLLSAAADK
jgi:hypothetical protein